MAKTKWTTEQQNAIDAEGGSVLVSAAAGSGKTAVLVERVFRMVTSGENPVPADRLLVLTFTNAAAEELRSRIAKKIDEAMRENNSPFLKKQRMLLRRAFIGTLDAYCQRLVAEHFAQLDLPANIRLGDASALLPLSEEALSETMEEMYDDAGFAAFADLYGKARTDKQAQDTVLALYDFTRTLPFPEKYLNHFEALYLDNTLDLADSPWGKLLLAHAGKAAETARQLAQEAVAAAEDEEALTVLVEALLQIKTAADELAVCVEAGAWDKAAAVCRAFTKPRFKPVRNYEGYGKDRVYALRDAAVGIFEDLKKRCFVCTAAEYHEDMQTAAPMVRALCKAARIYGEKLYAAKLREGLLDFADYEHLALRLLAQEDGGRTAHADKVSQSFAAVLVDEYQDTNELQNALYQCLGSSEGDNLFYVGDVKQSIYRFRKAEPTIFIEKKNKWAPYGTGQWPAVIHLGHNFRSGTGVIQGVNYVFETLMSPEVGDIAYDENEKLIQGSMGGDETGLELCVLNAAGNGDDASDGADARFTARRIRSMVASGFQVRDGDGQRACHYGDFAVLLRAKKRMQEFAAAMAAEGVPFVADTGEEALTSPEVLPLISMLGAIDNPGDSVALAAALMGPFFRFTPDDMIAIKSGAKGSLWGALVAAAAEQTLPQNICSKAAYCVESLRYYRAYSATVSAGELCRTLAEKSGYLSAVSAMESGSARRENVRRFIEWAEAASASGKGGLAAFLRLVQTGAAPEGKGMKSLTGHVSIMSIHKSKGLEFPVCILADAAHKFNTQDLMKRVQMDAELGIGLQLKNENGVIYPTLPAMAVRAKIENQNISEEMRVLYVALTRAKDRAIICFAVKDAEKFMTAAAAKLMDGKVNPYLLSKAGSMAEWITQAALLHPQSRPLLDYTGGFVPRRADTKANFAMQVLPAADYAGEEDAAAEDGFHLSATADAALYGELEQAFASRPAAQALAAVPLKLSVSDLVKQTAGFIPARPSFMYRQGLTAAEKGSAQHSFMQYADFDAARQDVDAEIARLVQAGLLQRTAAEAIDKAALEAFFASGLFARIGGAERLLREYDFITAIPAGQIQPDLPKDAQNEPVMLQGIADIVLLHDGEIEIADYKTDRNVSAEQLAKRYAAQLQTYAMAIGKRLGAPVTRLTIWSFYLNEAVDVSLQA